MKKLFLVCFVLFSTVCSVNADSGNTLASAEGRYVFGQPSKARADQYMLDTKTGRLWRVVFNKERTVRTLMPVLYRKDKGGYSQVPVQ